MPFQSKAQQRWGNSPSGVKALGGKAAVEEWNSSTPKGLSGRKEGGLKQAAKAALKKVKP